MVKQTVRLLAIGLAAHPSGTLLLWTSFGTIGFHVGGLKRFADQELRNIGSSALFASCSFALCLPLLDGPGVRGGVRDLALVLVLACWASALQSCQRPQIKKRGWMRIAFSSSCSKGKLPCPSLFKELISSAIISHAVRSALRICANETAANPGGGRWWRCSNSSA